MNYREAWANGEIEAGTLVDRIEEQAREIERLETALDDAANWDTKQLQVIHSLNAELAALKAQPSGVVLPEELTDKMRNSMAYVPGLSDTTMQDLLWLALKLASLNQPASAGDIFVVGYHCRDSKGIATINWLPHENAVPLMTVAQHQRILASATKQAGEVAYDVFVSRELLDLLADAEKNERHRNLKETRYWCDQYRQIARAALSANHSEQVREDTRLLDWLEENLTDTIYLDDGRIVDIAGRRTVREAIREAAAAPSSGSQKEQGE